MLTDLDLHTPRFGTPITEWMRQIDVGVDGQTVHEVRNTLAKLVGIRSDANEMGWTLALVQRDTECERHIRMIIRGSRRRRRVNDEQESDGFQVGWTRPRNGWAVA